jgi:glycosyltransferase involved in cell wall biosynthesis
LDVHLISQHPLTEKLESKVHLHLFPYRRILGYFTMVPGVKKILKNIQPHLINAHYASGYATTARLTGFHPWLLNVWGSDVYDFPGKSPIHRWWVRKNLLAADNVASTSHCMAEQTRQIAPSLKKIAITPFGVDVDLFAAAVKQQDMKTENEPIVIGTVKRLAPKYGVDTLVRAFSSLRERLRINNSGLDTRLRLRIVGDGPDREALSKLATDLGIANITDFVGRVPHRQVPAELSAIDIYVALSRFHSESFGVAVIEAGAAGRPVVVSNVGGLPEVVRDGETGFIVPPDDAEAAADALEQLVRDQSLRQQMGEAGARHVAENYSWDASVQIMIKVLEATRQSKQDNPMV